MQLQPPLQQLLLLPARTGGLPTGAAAKYRSSTLEGCPSHLSPYEMEAED